MWHLSILALERRAKLNQQLRQKTPKPINAQFHSPTLKCCQLILISELYLAVEISLKNLTIMHLVEFPVLCDHPCFWIRRRIERRLLPILVLWHDASLISLACSGQSARIAACLKVCVCAFVSMCLCACMGASGPVSATTLADVSNNSIRVS